MHPAMPCCDNMDQFLFIRRLPEKCHGSMQDRTTGRQVGRLSPGAFNVPGVARESGAVDPSRGRPCCGSGACSTATRAPSTSAAINDTSPPQETVSTGARNLHLSINIYASFSLCV
jgi:hypothetical protein